MGPGVVMQEVDFVVFLALALEFCVKMVKLGTVDLCRYGGIRRKQFPEYYTVNVPPYRKQHLSGV